MPPLRRPGPSILTDPAPVGCGTRRASGGHGEESAMRGLPPWPRGGTSCCAALAAALVRPPRAAAPATPWAAVALLAALYARLRTLRKLPLPGGRVPEGIGSFFPVLLAGVFLLPPPLPRSSPCPARSPRRAERAPGRARRRSGTPPQLAPRPAGRPPQRLHGPLGGTVRCPHRSFPVRAAARPRPPRVAFCAGARRPRRRGAGRRRAAPAAHRLARACCPGSLGPASACTASPG